MMVTTFDDEDVERLAVSLRKKFHFSRNQDNIQFPGVISSEEYNRKIQEMSRQAALELSREAAVTLFETMGAQRMPIPAKAA